MELRSCNHLHFIQAIRGDSIKKVWNVYRGRPSLKFKKVEDLYETKDTKIFESIPVFRPVGCDWEEAESLHRCSKERLTIESDGETFKSNNEGPEIGESELGDVNIGNMTLQQIKERCKEEKRKSSRYVDLSKGIVDTCSLGKQSLLEEDECDIMEPLSCWKSKILQKKKAKRKCKKKSLSQNVLAVVKSEDTPNDKQPVCQSDENFLVPINVKVEVSEYQPLYSEYGDIIIAPVDSDGLVPDEEHDTSSINNLETATLMITWEESDTANDCDLETRNGASMTVGEEPDKAKDYLLEAEMLTITGEQLKTNPCCFENQISTSCSIEPQCCATNEESYEHVVYLDPESISERQEPDKVKDCLLEAGMLGITGVQLNTNPYCFDSQMSTSCSIEPQRCATNEESYEHVVYPDPESIPERQASFGKIMMGDIAEFIGHQFSDLCLSEAKKVHSHPKNDSPETVSPSENHSLVICHDLLNFPSLNEKSEMSSSEGQVSVTGHSPTAKEKESPSSIHVETSLNCSAVAHSCVDEPLESGKVGEHQDSKLQHPPERLLCTRMAISPTSQKKLREAMESRELDDEQYYKYARKLCYSKQIENKVSRQEGDNHINRAEVIISPKKVVKKAKISGNVFHRNEKAKSSNNVFHRNENIKFSLPPRPVQRFSTGCTSIRSCSESAILFSQQQMHDIESVTTKLVKELQSMKEIVEESLQSKEYPASLKYSADEVRIAMQNASRVEEITRRSLSVMARDCSRFCKLMKLAEKGSSTSPNSSCKKRKIVFADEAGRKLCDVKTFVNDMTTFIDPKSEKPETDN